METTDQVRRFVIDNFLYGEEDGLQNTDSFMHKGIIDSTGTLELVNFLEQKFRIRVEDRELVPDNLDSVEKVAKFVDLKRQVP